jgi:hypothetical protein
LYDGQIFVKYREGDVIGRRESTRGSDNDFRNSTLAHGLANGGLEMPCQHPVATSTSSVILYSASYQTPSKLLSFLVTHIQSIPLSSACDHPLAIPVLSIFSLSLPSSQLNLYSTNSLPVTPHNIPSVYKLLKSQGHCPNMAATISAAPQALANNIVTAYKQTTSSSATRAQKSEALQYLEAFQKSVSYLLIFRNFTINIAQENAWEVLFQMLQSDSVDQATQMFAATSLKGKVC